MPIEDRNLSAGTKLVARYKGETYRAEVVTTADGLRYRLEDGREFKSPSSAGSAVMGGKSCNGWRFWGLATEAPRPSKDSKRDSEPGVAPAKGKKASAKPA